MSEDFQPTSRQTVKKPATLMTTILRYAGVLLIGILIGFVPMWLKARGYAGELEIARRELSLVRLQNTLGSAALDARRGDYEPARQAVSNFYTSLNTEAEKGADSALTDAQKQNVQSFFTGRDEVITLLARSDPASADRLSDLYAAYRKIMSS